MQELDKAAVNKAVAEIVADLDRQLSTTVSGVSQNRTLIEGARTSIETLIQAMQIHTQALKATNDILRDVLRRLVKLEQAAVDKEKPPAV